MDISDLDLMVRLPQIMNTSILDEIIKRQLEVEQIPSSQKYTECKFTEFGLSDLPRILPNTEGTKRRKTDKSNFGQNEGSGKQLDDKSKESGAELSVRTDHTTIRSNPTPISPSLHSEAKQTKRESQTTGVSTGSDSSREENSDKVVASEIDRSIQSKHEIESQAGTNDTAISGSVSTESQTHKTEKMTSVQLLHSIADSSGKLVPKIFLFLSGDEDLQQQETLQEDVLAMESTIQILVEALTKVLPDVPRHGTENWKKFRQEQLDARMQKDVSKISLDVASKTAENEAVKVFEIATVKIVKFVKKIPEYLEFSLDDQIKLIKGARHEPSLFTAFRSLNNEIKMMTPVQGIHFTFEELSFVFPDEVVNFIVGQSKNKIWQTITEKEEALLFAILLTDADRCTDLQNEKQVRKVHAHLIACLRHVVTQEATDIRRRHEDLSSVLQTFRYMTTHFLENFKERLIRVPAHADNQTLNEVL